MHVIHTSRNCDTLYIPSTWSVWWSIVFGDTVEVFERICHISGTAKNLQFIFHINSLFSQCCCHILYQPARGHVDIIMWKYPLASDTRMTGLLCEFLKFLGWREPCFYLEWCMPLVLLQGWQEPWLNPSLRHQGFIPWLIGPIHHSALRTCASYRK